MNSLSGWGSMLLALKPSINCSCSTSANGLNCNVLAYPSIINGITVNTSTLVNTTFSNTSYWSSTCSITSGYGSYKLNPNSLQNSASLTYTFSSPVNDIIITGSGMESMYSPAESYTFSVNNGTLNSQLGLNCAVIQSGNTYTANISTGQAGFFVKLHSSIPYTSITINGVGNELNNGATFSICFVSSDTTQYCKGKVTRQGEEPIATTRFNKAKEKFNDGT